MKKFIIVVLFAIIPSFAFADTLGCVGGGLLLGGIGSQIGGGPVPVILGVIGALKGCDAGSRIEDGTYGKDSEVETIYVSPSRQYHPRYNEYNSRYGGAMCDDPGSGGRASCAELERRHQARARGYYAPRAAYRAPPQAVSYPRNMWERADRKQQNTEAPKPAAVVGPTVNNYLEDSMVHKSCKVGNYGHDGKCLLDFVPKLAKEQKGCEADSKKCYQYNAGKWAGIYNRLGKELLQRQKEEQGGEFTTN